MTWVGTKVRRFTKWKRMVLSRLSLHYPPLVRLLITPRPLQIHRRPYQGSAKHKDLLVCLPGIGDEGRDFEDWGFVDLVKARQWAVDVWLVDAHYGYYADRTILDQLQQDVFMPAAASGYRAIWLAGISLGGFGALLYASRYPQAMSGVVALAPFLGTQTIISEIALAGGLTQWATTITTGDEICALWKWLESHTHSSGPFPDIYLGFGEEDQFAEAHRLLASSLPPSHVLTVAGGHRWPVWQQLWKKFLHLHVAPDASKSS